MKSPITGEEMTLKTKLATIQYKGKDVTYKHTFYFDGVESFTTTEIDEENLKEMRRQYEKNQTLDI